MKVKEAIGYSVGAAAVAGVILCGSMYLMQDTGTGALVNPDVPITNEVESNEAHEGNVPPTPLVDGVNTGTRG